MNRNARDRRVGRRLSQDSRGSRHRVLRERDRRRTSRRRGAAALVVTGVAAVVGYASAVGGLSGEPVVLRSIAVQGLHRLTPDEVAATTGIERGAPVERIDVAALVGNLQSHPWIESARAVALPDGTLVVRVQEREPAAWVSGKGVETRWVDVHGRAFAPASPAELDPELWPQIVGAGPPELDPTQGPERLARAVALARLAVERGVPGPVRVSLPGAPGVADGAGWVLWPHAPALEAWLGEDVEHFPERLGRLARLLEEDPARARQASQIDLRFSGRAFLRFAESGEAGRMSSSRNGADAGGGSVRRRGAVQTRPTG